MGLPILAIRFLYRKFENFESVRLTALLTSPGAETNFYALFTVSTCLIKVKIQL